ncbi:hypothetical protein AVEN_147135-1 [Araneus ventricosus]|uniref:Uncharacterized protein n=1 Tax=Araneus ventricosus TaxID=182803 RepID=A0A4Y2GFF1_ARAVE|nr:hypothetical protein AVEN_147135-1 [Araneus ventricosus]
MSICPTCPFSPVSEEKNRKKGEVLKFGTVVVGSTLSDILKLPAVAAVRLVYEVSGGLVVRATAFYFYERGFDPRLGGVRSFVTILHRNRPRDKRPDLKLLQSYLGIDLSIWKQMLRAISEVESISPHFGTKPAGSRLIPMA